MDAEPWVRLLCAGHAPSLPLAWRGGEKSVSTGTDLGIAQFPLEVSFEKARAARDCELSPSTSTGRPSHGGMIIQPFVSGLIPALPRHAGPVRFGMREEALGPHKDQVPQ